jgi:hypothetical protein
MKEKLRNLALYLSSTFGGAKVMLVGSYLNLALPGVAPRDIDLFVLTSRDFLKAEPAHFVRVNGFDVLALLNGWFIDIHVREEKHFDYSKPYESLL